MTLAESPARSQHASPGQAGVRVRRLAQLLKNSRLFAWVVLGATGFALFHRALIDLWVAVGQGEPVGYLILMPAWVWAIAHRSLIAHNDRPDIADHEVDWIVGLGIAVFLVSCQQLAAPRLADAAALWHFDIVGLIGWSAGCSVVLFGLRAVARAWPAWCFVLACFPSLQLLLGMAVGGSAAAYGLIAVIYGSIALCLAVELAWPRRMALTAAALLLGAMLVHVLEGRPVPVQQVLPAAVVPTVLYFVSLRWARTENWFAAAHHHPTLPGMTRRDLLALALLTCAAMLVVDDARLGELDTTETMVDSGWTQDVTLPAPFSLHAGPTYAWAARSFGRGAGIQRYFVEKGGGATESTGVVGAVDVVTVEQPGRLRTYPSGIIYPASPPVRYLSEPVDLGHGVEAVVQYTSAQAAQTPSDPLWVMLTWNWRLADSRHQRVTVIVSQQPGRRELLPQPRQPALAEGVLEPLLWLLQTSSDDAPILLPQALAAATDYARDIVTSAHRTTAVSPVGDGSPAR